MAIETVCRDPVVTIIGSLRFHTEARMARQIVELAFLLMQMVETLLNIAQLLNG